MAISDQVQMLSAAFIFGLLFQAAIAALFLYFKGHGSTLFQDHRRLVLVLFLKSAAMWAQIDFINFAVPPSSETVCQVTVAISTFFDQAARVIMGAFLLWSVGHVRKSMAERYGLGALVGIRAAVGGVFVGYTRPQFAPLCVARSDMLPVSITIMTLDLIIIGIVTIRVFTLGLMQTIREVRSSTRQEQSKALVYCTAGFSLWTLTSVVMLLGMESLILLLRTALPALGLMALITIMTIFTGGLVLPREEDSCTPEARSPFVAPPSRSLESFGDSNGSPVFDNEFTKTGKLFVVNPSSSTRNTSEQGNFKVGNGMNRKFSTAASTVVEREAPTSMGGNSGFAAVGEAILFASAARSTSMGQSGGLPEQDNSTMEKHQKNSLFGRLKKPTKDGVRGLAISGPVINDVEIWPAQPLARIRTVDLITAAASQRERREVAASRQLIAQRPAPPPPIKSAMEALRKSTSTRRKEIPRTARVLESTTTAPSPSSLNNSRLSVDVNASSTSASLSPGLQDIRRRSPRTMESLEQDMKRSNIPGLRVQTRLNGLPVNFRQPSIHRKDVSQQNGMYINDNVYDQPGTVKSVINGTPNKFVESKPKQLPDVAVSPKSSKSTTSTESIMHRPRPQRQNSGKERALFPSEPLPHHKRSKSSSSVMTSKTGSTSRTEGTEFAARPLQPNVPTSAARLQKLLPSDTRSMTIDEKISLLFPAPPGAQSIHKRTSSVPSIPRIPSSLLASEPSGNFLTEQELQERRSSKRTTISFGANPIIDGVIPAAETPIINDYQTYRFSANAYRTAMEAPPANVMAKVPAHTPIMNRASRQVPTVPSPQGSTISESVSEEGSHDDSKSAWASIHSPTPALDLTMAQRTARETFIRMRKELDKHIRSSNQIPASLPEPEDEVNMSGDGEGLMTVMLGFDEVNFMPATNRRSFLLDASPISPDGGRSMPPAKDAWHCRIGDELPAFSERRKYLRSRSMPPPTPLLLGSRGRHATVVSRELSVENVVDSPGKAIKRIQEQLSKFEDPSRESLGSLIRHMPGNSSTSSAKAIDDRLGLLENLEKEMGQQETHWMRMQHNIDRDSNHSLTMTPRNDDQKPLPSPPSEESSRRSSINVTRRQRIRSNATAVSKRDNSTSTSSTQSSENSRASRWQQRLAEAQMEYMENAPALLGKQNMNYLALSKAQLASPTPPDSNDSASDSGTDIEYDSDEEIHHSETSMDIILPTTPSKVEALWEPRSISPVITVGHLWSHALASFRIDAAPHVPPPKMSRTPNRRHEQLPLTIISSTLWSKPTASANRPPVGLWGSRMTRPQSIITRPKTQKPQRKSKRVTFLPDIIESPIPLPHKRDTLGIFQFPWGEKSDSAVYDPIPLPNRATLQALVMSSYLDTKPLPIPPELAEYSSTFFDDYEDEFDDDSEETSDDDFDESTLWEIATLLDSSQVPSRNSLLPPPHIIEDYDDDEDDDSDSEVMESMAKLVEPVQALARPTMVKFIPIQPLKPASPKSSLWTGNSKLARSASRPGLPQPAAHVWQEYQVPVDAYVRAKPCMAENQAPLSKINSRKLWDKAIRAVSNVHLGNGSPTLWTSGVSDAEKLSPSNGESVFKYNPAAALWTPKEEKLAIQVNGLFVAGKKLTDYRTSNQAPAALATIRKPRIDAISIPSLKSQKLWSPSKANLSENHWISKSSFAEPCPSLSMSSSTSSSGRSSPASGRSTPSPDDVSTPLVRTQATSIWGSDLNDAADFTEEPTSYLHNAKNSDSVASVNTAQMQSKTSVFNPSKLRESIRISRVLASRDLWESKTIVAGFPPSTTRTWRSTRIVVPNKVVVKEKRKAQHPATATEWDAALAEAMARSQIKPSTTSASCQLWTPSSSSSSGSKITPRLWSAQPALKADSFVAVSHEASQPVERKATKSSALVTLPTLEFSSFWAPTESTVSGRKHWLHDTALIGASPS